MYFWRQTKDIEMPAEQVINRLVKDTPLEGIAVFPRARVRDVFRKGFPDIVDGDADLDWEGAGSYFRVGFAHANEKEVQMIIVTCGYSLLKSEKTMNRIIEVCCSLGCALYDPQTGRRNEQQEPKNVV